MREIKERFLANPRNPNANAPPNEKISNPLYTLDWFDRYFRLLTRIDVYKKPFPIDRKWQTYRRGFTRVLVYRNDLKLSEQAELISHFLGIKLGEIQNRNSVKNENYSRFCESVKLPEWYIRRTHDSRGISGVRKNSKRPPINGAAFPVVENRDSPGETSPLASEAIRLI